MPSCSSPLIITIIHYYADVNDVGAISFIVAIMTMTNDNRIINFLSYFYYCCYYCCLMTSSISPAYYSIYLIVVPVIISSYCYCYDVSKSKTINFKPTSYYYFYYC